MWTRYVSFSFLFVFHMSFARAQTSTSAGALATQYALPASTSLPFPTPSQNVTAESFLISKWSLGTGKVQFGTDDIAFVDDPFPDSPAPGTTPSSPVLQVKYPAGSYSHGTGGAEFYSIWNESDGSPFQSMILSYELAFDTSFDFVKGGKLPGLRGGLDQWGCSGGLEPNGSDCFSTRLMWRTAGAGEVYAYILTSDGLCSENGTICDSDYGISLNRGSFSFTPGQWSHITLFVQLNDPPSQDNGNLMMFFNDVLVLSRPNLQYRNSSDIDIGGLFFSTFFGGHDDSYATPVDARTFFRNFQLWGGSSSPNVTVTAPIHKTNGAMSSLFFWDWILFTSVGLGILLIC